MQLLGLLMEDGRPSVNFILKDLFFQECDWIII